MDLRPALLSISLLLIPPAASAVQPAGAAVMGVRVRVDYPKPGEAIKNRVHQAPIRGSASAEGEKPANFDVIIVIDVSGSTRNASGVDVDGDGEIGFNPHMELVEPGKYGRDVLSTDPGDSILAAEVGAAKGLLDGLNASRVRVGVVSFSGEMNKMTGRRLRPNQQDAWLEVPLTKDYARVRTGLDGILKRGPHGATNFAAGLRLAITELSGFSGARSTPGLHSKKVVLFLTDGLPTFPIGTGQISDAGDIESALLAARVAHSAQITINTYALGPSALTSPIAATEIARITLGTYLPVRNPGDIVSFLQSVSFANIEDVVFTNLTTSEVSTDVRLAPDGTFSGFVPVREGSNRVRVTALASDGTTGSVELDLNFETQGLSGRELELEIESIRKRNRELMLLIERKKIQRFRDQQRKVLEITPATDDDGEPE